MKALLLILSSLLLISCSNMTIGFEEDSILYNGPIIDTREDVNTTQFVKKDMSEKREETVVEEKPEAVEEKESREVPKKSEAQESDTTFYYERDDE